MLTQTQTARLRALPAVLESMRQLDHQSAQAARVVGSLMMTVTRPLLAVIQTSACRFVQLALKMTTAMRLRRVLRVKAARMELVAYSQGRNVSCVKLVLPTMTAMPQHRVRTAYLDFLL